MFSVATREFGDVDLVCPGAGIYEPVRETTLPRTLADMDRKTDGINGHQQEIWRWASS